MTALSSLTDDEIDRLLLEQVIGRWQKVAKVIILAIKEYHLLDQEDEDRLDDRIAALIEAGKIESAGNIRKWRYSEIRLNSAN